MKAKRFVSIICALIVLIGCCSVLLACQPKHTCQNVCQDCGKCLNADCAEEACVDKCLGHHVCDSVCAKCGKCTDKACTEAICADKCPRDHHECRTVCDTCNKCMDYFCHEQECVVKCDCPHPCQSVCSTCNKCTDIYCKHPNCRQKCDQAPVIGSHIEYTGEITASESDEIVCEFSKGKEVDYYVFWVYEMDLIGFSTQDYSPQDYIENRVAYTFDMASIQHLTLRDVDKSKLHIERHPCSIPNMFWTNVVYVYYDGQLALEFYYNSPLEVSISCFQLQANRYTIYVGQGSEPKQLFFANR